MLVHLVKLKVKMGAINIKKWRKRHCVIRIKKKEIERALENFAKHWEIMINLSEIVVEILKQSLEEKTYKKNAPSTI